MSARTNRAVTSQSKVSSLQFENVNSRELAPEASRGPSTEQPTPQATQCTIGDTASSIRGHKALKKLIYERISQVLVDGRSVAAKTLLEALEAGKTDQESINLLQPWMDNQLEDIVVGVRNLTQSPNVVPGKYVALGSDSPPI